MFKALFTQKTGKHILLWDVLPLFLARLRGGMHKCIPCEPFKKNCPRRFRGQRTSTMWAMVYR